MTNNISAGNIRVTVLYPRAVDTTFEADYWLSNHYDLVSNGVWHEALYIEMAMANDAAPFYATASVVFADKATHAACLAHPGMADVAADLANFTTTSPVVFISEVARNSN
jgi:uncharacterized protein (TIGR02118 family)